MNAIIPICEIRSITREDGSRVVGKILSEDDDYIVFYVYNPQEIEVVRKKKEQNSEHIN